MEKSCFKCGLVKPLDEFYVHKQMADGHINKCKSCTKKDVRDRQANLRNNLEWLRAERERGVLKYHRLNYRDKPKPSKNRKREIINKYKTKFPEKLAAKSNSQKIKCRQGYHKHHWSYLIEHWKDVIELTVKAHSSIHRFMVYDQEQMMYRTLSGKLLNTREKHITYYKECLKNYPHSEKYKLFSIIQRLTSPNNKIYLLPRIAVMLAS